MYDHDDDDPRPVGPRLSSWAWVLFFVVTAALAALYFAFAGGGLPS